MLPAAPSNTPQEAQLAAWIGNTLYVHGGLISAAYE